MDNDPILKNDPLGDTIKLHGNWWQRFKTNLHLGFASTFSSAARKMIKDLKKSEFVHDIYLKKFKEPGGSITDPKDLSKSMVKGSIITDPDDGAKTIGTGEGSGTNILLNLKSKNIGTNINGKPSGSKTIVLLHELFHAWESNYGKLDLTVDNQSVSNAEKNTINWENMFRTQLGFLGIFGMKPRKTYEVNDKQIDIYDPNFKEDYKKSDPSDKSNE